jgi:hypothetical protein
MLSISLVKPPKEGNYVSGDLFDLKNVRVSYIREVQILTSTTINQSDAFNLPD